MIWLVGCSIAVLIIAFYLRHHAKERVTALGLSGEAVYWDGGTDNEVFVSHAHGLTGKPDYILKISGYLVPVERKSRHVSVAGPHEGEILQLAAYCLLVEERFRRRVQRGQLQYPNRSFAISFNDQLRSKLLEALRALREADAVGDVPRSHNSPARCRGCGFKAVCKDSLAPCS